MILQHSALKKLIGGELPPDAQGLGFARVRPGGDISFTLVFARFSTSPEHFAALMRRMGMNPPDSGDGLALLPAAWRPSQAPDWWQPGPGTPNESAARFTPTGRIIAKYEAGSAYILMTDLGMIQDEETES
jgi:hypothetical protein